MPSNIFIILLGTMTLTAYQPVPKQTRPECNGIQNCFTSIGDIPTKFGAAVSQDLIQSGQVHYGDGLYIEGLSTIRIVNDCMNKRHHKAVDILVWSHEDEARIGIKHRKVWVIHLKGDQLCNTSHIPKHKIHQTVGTVNGGVTNHSSTIVHSELK